MSKEMPKKRKLLLLIMSWILSVAVLCALTCFITLKFAKNSQNHAMPPAEIQIDGLYSHAMADSVFANKLSLKLIKASIVSSTYNYEDGENTLTLSL